MSSFLNSSRFAAVGNSFSSKTTFASHESAHVENDDALLASAAHSASKTSLDVVVVVVVVGSDDELHREDVDSMSKARLFADANEF